MCTLCIECKGLLGDIELYFISLVNRNRAPRQEKFAGPIEDRQLGTICRESVLVSP